MFGRSTWYIKFTHPPSHLHPPFHRSTAGAIVVLTDESFGPSLNHMLRGLDDDAAGGVLRIGRRRVTSNVIAVTDFERVDADALLYVLPTFKHT